jgi:predicted nucleic acid-binding protein
VSGYLDTSVIVRYLTGDVPEMARRAAGIIDEEDDLTVTDVVLVETAYVLTSVYKVPREVVVNTLIAFIQKENISTFPLDKGSVLQAMLLCRSSGRVSFADAALWSTARYSGSGVVYSLDERFPADGIEVKKSP